MKTTQPSAPCPREDGRAADALRPLDFELNVQRHAAGSVLIRAGHTHVLCAVSVEARVPPHRLASGGGWLTAEYALLPGATDRRVRRERSGPSGRTAEIQRLIGRSLRAVVDIDRLGARTFHVDCDVLQADGGTRCASITGAWVALQLAMRRFGVEAASRGQVAAVSLGILGGEVRCDLDYAEDSQADVDFNYVAAEGGLVELQGCAEGGLFSRAQLNAMLDQGERACAALFEAQRRALALGIERG